MQEQPTVAAFDFDGTLTYHDTLFSFLLFVCGPLKTFRILFLKLPVLIAYILGSSSRQATKESILTAFFSGIPIAELEEKGKEFAESVLNQKLMKKAVERLRWHQALGHRCILISASIDTYLKFWGEQNGFADVICSEIEVVNGRVTGKLKGKNCWGEEKTRRLIALLGPKNYTLYAYGNSRGDQELLEMADFAYYKTHQDK